MGKADTLLYVIQLQSSVGLATHANNKCYVKTVLCLSTLLPNKHRAVPDVRQRPLI